MRKNFLASAIAACAAMVSVSAVAQTAPSTSAGRWPMAVGEKTCTGQPAHPLGGLNWRLGCEATCPVGSSLVTGGCRTLSTDNQGLALEGAGPSGNGWSCDYVASRHDIDRSGGISPRTRVKAEAHCRDHSLFPVARWMTPAEGTLMVVARSGTDIGEKIRFSIRLCNSEGPLPVSVHLLTRDPEKPSIPERPAPHSVPLGSCLQVDGPVAVFVQNGQTQASGLSGTYQLYREGTFKPVPEVLTMAAIAANQRDERAIERRSLKASPPEFVKTACEKLEGAAPGVYGRCTVKEVNEQANYRFCFGPTFAPPVNTEPSYPGDLLPMVLNPKLTEQPIPPSYNTNTPGGRDAHNPVYPNSCRDYLNVRDVNFMLLQRPAVPIDQMKNVWFSLQKLW